MFTKSEIDLICNLLEAHKAEYSFLLGFGQKSFNIIKQEKEVDKLIKKISKLAN